MTRSLSGYAKLTTTGPCPRAFGGALESGLPDQLSCAACALEGSARHREGRGGQRRDGAGQRRGLAEPLVVMLP
jgi:hypothetical protein